jgi:two-component system sensor histidine kinase UhpB
MTRSRAVGRLVVFEVGFLAAYAWGMTWAGSSAGGAMWPPDAVLLAALLLDDRKRWWWYIVAALPIRFLVMVPALPAWFLWAAYINDSIKAMLSAYLIRRYRHEGLILISGRDVAMFVVIAGVVSPAISASGGAFTQWVLGNEFWDAWRQWFLGNSVAAIVLVPAILFVAHRRFRTTLPTRIEVGLIAIGVIATAWFAFASVNRVTAYAPLLLYVPVPLIFWAGFRIGAAGASLALSVVSLFMMAAAAGGHGPFMAYGHLLNIVAVQLFLILLAVPVTVLVVLIDALAQSRHQLQGQTADLRALAGRLITAQEDERRRIARDIHDDIGQRLASIRVALELFARQDTVSTDSHLIGVRHDLDEVARDIHHLSRGLHPSVLDHLGLPDALRSLGRQMAAQHKIAIDVIAPGNGSIAPDVSMCLYRVAQEALTNAVKHGGAQRVTVQLTNDDSVLRLRVADAGRGFDLSSVTAGLGLAGMRERLRLMDGRLHVVSAPAKGTEVSAEIPLRS